MILIRNKILFTGLICLLIAGFGVHSPAFAQVHGCTLEGAVDMSGQPEVTVENWANTFSSCIIVSPHTTVTWDGNLTSHPLLGGTTPTKDGSSPISSPGNDVNVVEFIDEGTFPYFCGIHTGTMTGVIYVVATPPENFSKTNPTHNAGDQSISPNLTWASSTGDITYEYCIETDLDGECDDGWNHAGDSTNANPGVLEFLTTYDWQVRAVNDEGETLANSGTWWQFTTTDGLAGEFSKTSPTNNAIDQSLSPNLSWASSTDVIDYEYCVDQTLNSTCNDEWINVGGATNDNLTDLGNNTVYEWQVRAVNDNGNTQANTGTWWQFTTIDLRPGAFDKTSPADNAIDQPTSPTLDWASSAGATSYEYCYDTVLNSTCNNDLWKLVGSLTHGLPNPLQKNKTYEWQARAVNVEGHTEANTGTWWQFTTVPDVPGPFSKTSPSKDVTNQSTSPTLSWESSAGATLYEYCIDTSDNDVCNTAWTSTGTNTSIKLEDLSLITLYHWHVRATNAGGTTTANGETWWNFTTTAVSDEIHDDGFEAVDP